MKRERRKLTYYLATIKKTKNSCCIVCETQIPTYRTLNITCNRCSLIYENIICSKACYTAFKLSPKNIIYSKSKSISWVYIDNSLARSYWELINCTTKHVIVFSGRK